MKGRRRLLKNGHRCERGRESEKVRVPFDLTGPVSTPTGVNGSRARPPEACGARTCVPRMCPP
jgi:hypothetical protein